MSKHNPELISIVEDKTITEYTPEFYNQLRDLVGDELILEGFDEDWRSNNYGIALEDLIDEIGRLFMWVETYFPIERVR